MIKGYTKTQSKEIKEGDNYIRSFRKSIARSLISLKLFIGFASLYFVVKVQMSFSMDQLATSSLFFFVMFQIGLLLGISFLHLAMNLTYECNKEYMTLLKAYSYTDKKCLSILYKGYILTSIIGFGVETIYQFYLIKFMVKVFQDVIEVEFKYNVPGLIYTILIFIPVYILIEFMFFYKMKKQRISLVLMEH